MFDYNYGVTTNSSACQQQGRESGIPTLVTQTLREGKKIWMSWIYSHKSTFERQKVDDI